MKRSTFILATLITLGSTSAFAEDGSERSQQFWDNFRVSQQQTHSAVETTASSETPKNNIEPSADKTSANTPDA